jgi:hypothetical protein
VPVQAVPSGWFDPPWQAPVAGLQVPPVVQALLAQLTGLLPPHTPAPSQAKVLKQRFWPAPGVHVVPAASGG